MIFPYKFQSQPFKPWKGTSTKSVVPGNSRGGVNGTSDKAHDFIGPNFKARPIKHYRKKLIPNPNSGSSKASVKNVIDAPGSMIYLGESDCCESSSGINTTNLISSEKNNIFYIRPSDKFFDSKEANISKWQYCNAQDRPVCVSCNPENNIIKSGICRLNKNYYTNSKAYLQSRCQLYNQKLSTNKKNDVDYFDKSGLLLHPNDDLDGPQNFNTQNCPKGCSIPAAQCDDQTGCPYGNVTTIYKPSNSKFAHQGAVSSSNRLLRLKVDTITKNGNSFRSAFGSEAANAGRYTGKCDGPYFIKSKMTSCIKNKRQHSTYQKNSNQLFSRRRKL